jgi:hypothetical protein
MRQTMQKLKLELELLLEARVLQLAVLRPYWRPLL